MSKNRYGDCPYCGGRLILHQHEELYEYDFENNPVYRLIKEYVCSKCHRDVEDGDQIVNE